MSKQELITIKQLPIIEEQLKTLSKEIKTKVDNALKLVVTEDTVKDVKKTRAELNKEFKELEDKRKEVKTAVMTPYEQFEDIYKENVSDLYKEADQTLKVRIDSVEDELKKEKEKEVKEYFQELIESENIDFITFESVGLNVTLSVTLTALKRQTNEFVNRIKQDLGLIDTQDNKDEIMVEYKQSLNVSEAIQKVKARHEALELEKKRKEELQKVKEQETKIVEKTEKIVAPVKEKELTITFKVTGTKDELIKLREFMKVEGIKYE